MQGRRAQTASRHRFVGAQAWIQNRSAWLDQRDDIGPQRQLIVLGVVALILILRRPSLFYHAQFYAEDGSVWYRQAYSMGWLHSFTLPYAGYFNAVQRLGAGLSLLVPFRWAPLVMALAGLLVQCLPVCVLLSERCRNWGSLSTRALFAILYVVIPNAPEIHVVLTNSGWHLALVAALLAFASAPRTWLGRLSDVALLLLAGVTGPFCIMLIPLVLGFWWVRRQPWSLAVAAAMVPGVLCQLYTIKHSPARSVGPLGAGLEPLLRMIGGDIIGCTLFGALPIAHHAPMALIVPAAIGGMTVYLYALRFANVELKLFILFTWLLLAAALRSPLGGGQRPLWLLVLEAYGGRYWFFPMMAFVWSLVWCVRNANHSFIRVTSQWTLVVMLIGIAHNLVYLPFPDENFPLYAKRFQEAQPGTRVEILLHRPHNGF